MTKTGARVLVVDDQWAIRKQLSRALEAVGVRCDCAVNGDDALEQYLYEGHELIVTDLRMPEENGHSLAVSVLGLPDPPKVVALTAITDPRLAEDLRARGVTGVAFKPINYFAFAGWLKGLLAESPSPREQELDLSAAMQAPQKVDLAQPVQSPATPSRSELEQQFTESSPPHPWLTMALKGLDWDQLPNPPLEMRDAMRKLSRPSTHDPQECRREGRITLNEKAVALALNDSLEPIGRPFKTIIKDVAEHGVGLIHTEKLPNQPLAVSWQGLRNTRIVVLARVLRCRPVGDFFDVGAVIAHFKRPTLSDA